MIKVKATVKLKKTEKFPLEINIDVPKECCNRKDFNKYIESVVTPLIMNKLRISHEVIESVTPRLKPRA